MNGQSSSDELVLGLFWVEGLMFRVQGPYWGGKGSKIMIWEIMLSRCLSDEMHPMKE